MSPQETVQAAEVIRGLARERERALTVIAFQRREIEYLRNQLERSGRQLQIMEREALRQETLQFQNAFWFELCKKWMPEDKFEQACSQAGIGNRGWAA